MRKIALFGGSFDPVQNGHVEFIRLLAARFDKTIVVPCRISPFKTEADIASGARPEGHARAGARPAA